MTAMKMGPTEMELYSMERRKRACYSNAKKWGESYSAEHLMERA
jgi:hypothetical protein